MKESLQNYLSARYGYHEFALIEKGWSGDQKYCAVRSDGSKDLVRIADAGTFEVKKKEYEVMRQIAALGIPMCLPLALGTYEEFTYSIQSWIDGEDAEETIPLLSDTQQYVYGLQAGEILRRIHSLPAPAEQPGWEERFNKKMDRKIAGYNACDIKFRGGSLMIGYINENRGLLSGRPQSVQHGDYHIGNMMIDRNGALIVIDFHRFDYGDPWEEFNRIVWCAGKSPLFASGMVNGYFGSEPPGDFWRLLALYISSNTLSSVYWAVPFGEKEVNTMLHQAEEVLGWYDDMKTCIPSWYTKGYYLQYIDGMPCKLKEPFDFGFLSRYGTVFRVFDDQDSGNICFGTEKDGKRYFIKFAGAPTEQYSGEPAAAVERLKRSTAVYRVLAHESLIRFVEEREIGGGFAAVFEWTDAECMGRMYPASRKKFFAMPMETKLQVYLDILEFHRYAASRGYVAIDFYDGSIMYDFKRKRTVVCDIDFYAKAPYINRIGRLWGSSRFMSPEEYTLNAAIDEVTNVYTMGAAAFALFSGYDRTPEKWPLGAAAFDVVTRAVNNDRRLRQQTIGQLINEWKAAVKAV